MMIIIRLFKYTFKKSIAKNIKNHTFKKYTLRKVQQNIKNSYTFVKIIIITLNEIIININTNNILKN